MKSATQLSFAMLYGMMFERCSSPKKFLHSGLSSSVYLLLMEVFSIGGTTFRSISICPVSSTVGVTLCASAPGPTVVLENISRTQCSLQCVSTIDGQPCLAFNYNLSTQQCSVYTVKPTIYSTATDCVNYQPQLLAYPGAVTASNAATDCGFPFTYQGQLYYKCMQTVFDSGNFCNKFACMLPKSRDLATCLQPSAQTFSAPVYYNVLLGYPPCVMNDALDVCVTNASVPLYNVSTAAFNWWILFQQRMDNSSTWNLTWDDYKFGFGRTRSNFWMGLNNLTQITYNYKQYRLRVELSDGKGDWFSIEYPSFWIDSEANLYSIHLGSGIGDVDDALFLQNGKNFSTYDQDHDGHPSSNCAGMYSGGWWYSGCGSSVLNSNNISWVTSGRHGFQSSRMMIKDI